jgi:16S rRNA (adenine1518-N6/adenine1519-N6)-dimethyltransferase
MDNIDQNFMVDPETIGKIVNAAGIRPRETVLEIGAGRGALTRELVKRAKKVIAIELDPELADDIRMRKVQVVYGNALDELADLKFDLIVSNLPYSICEALVGRLIFKEFRLAILTVPKGFAYILAAEPASDKYSRLSIVAQAFYDMEILFDVPKDAFKPRPNTSSVVIKLSPKKEKTFMAALFLQPRKLMKNALREALCERKKMTKSQARKAIKSFNLNNIILSKKVMELTADDCKMLIDLNGHK